MAVHAHVFWPLKCSSDVFAVNGDGLKMHHLRVVSRVLNNVIMFGRTFQEHPLTLRKVFERSKKPA